MKKIILFVLFLFPVLIVRADPGQVPASAADAVGLPSTRVSSPPDSGPRAEIERLWMTGEKKKAQARLTEWKSKEKSSPWPWVVSARFQFEEKNFKKCISLAEVALIKAPQCGEAYYWKGRGLEFIKKPLEAANEYRAAVTAPQKFYDAQKDLDRILLTLGQ